MCKKALIIQHVLPKFQLSVDGRGQFNPNEYIPKIRNWIVNCCPEKVIVTKELSDDLLYPEFEHIGEVQEWKWEPLDYNDQISDMANKLGVSEENLVISWAHSEAYCSIIYEWMEELDGHDVIVMGGFKEECLQGPLDGLKHLNTRDTNTLNIMYESHKGLLYPRNC